MASFFTKDLGLCKDNQPDNDSCCPDDIYYSQYIPDSHHPTSHERKVLRETRDQHMKKDEPRRHAYDQTKINHVAKQFEGDLVLLWDKEKENPSIHQKFSSL